MALRLRGLISPQKKPNKFMSIYWNAICNVIPVKAVHMDCRVSIKLILISTIGFGFGAKSLSAESCQISSKLEAQSLELIQQIEEKTELPDPTAVKKELQPLFDQFTRSCLYIHQEAMRKEYAETIKTMTEDAIARSPFRDNLAQRSTITMDVDAEVVSKALMTEKQPDKFKKSAGLLQTLSRDSLLHTAQYAFNNIENLQREIDKIALGLKDYGIQVQLPKRGNRSGQLVQLDQIYRAIATDAAAAAHLRNKTLILEEVKGKSPQIADRGKSIVIQFDANGWDQAIAAFSDYGQEKAPYVDPDDKDNANLIEANQSFVVIKLKDDGKPRWTKYSYTMIYGNPDTFRGIMLNGQKSKDWIAENSGAGVLTHLEIKRQMNITSKDAM